jgi:hypothetical protein
MALYILVFFAWLYAVLINKNPRLVAITGWVLAFGIFSFLMQIGATQ